MATLSAACGVGIADGRTTDADAPDGSDDRPRFPFVAPGDHAGEGGVASAEGGSPGGEIPSPSTGGAGGAGGSIAPAQPGAGGAGDVPVPPPGGEGGAPPVEEGTYDASWHEDLFPRSLGCSEPFAAVLTYRNAGTARWRPGVVSLRLVGGESLGAPLELALDREVPPGELHTFSFGITAPGADGIFRTDWQLAHGAETFGELTWNDVAVTGCGEVGGGAQRALPDVRAIIEEVHASDPSMIAESCQDTGGNWRFMDAVVDRLRRDDDRWGYNGKRGNSGDPSRDAIDWHWGDDPREGSTNVYILDIIGGHCGPNPRPTFTDQTQATADGGTIGRWTGRGRF